MRLYLAMEKELLVVRQREGRWSAESVLVGMETTCVASDPRRPERVYCGTFGRGLWRSSDAGASWQPVGDSSGGAMGQFHDDGITQAQITSVAVSATEVDGQGYGVVYVGTEPSTLYRSEDGGAHWQDLKSLRELPSAPDWHFPPRPFTNHVRWITPDPLQAGRLFVAIEAGALVRSLDGGQTWEDRRPDGPLDTHTLRMHPSVPNRLYSAAGDGFGHNGRGYNVSNDGGESWQRPDEGLQHHYFWGLAVDSADPEIVLASASSSPFAAHHGGEDAQSVLYRKEHDLPWQRVTSGLPADKGMVVPVLASHPSEGGTFYALTNLGLYSSHDTGLHWEEVPLPWKSEYRQQHQQALTISAA